MPQKRDGSKFTSWGLNWMISHARVAKYKQRRQIYTRGFDVDYPGLAIGACTALSTAWIKSHQANPGQAPSERLDSFNSDADYAVHNIVAGKFNGERGSSSQAERIAKFSVDAFGAKQQDVVDKTHTQASLSEFSALLTFLDANPGYYMVMLEITNHGTSHVCAMYAGKNEMRFFDPNFGEFQRKNGDRGAFFVRLREQYEGYVLSDGTKKKLEFDKGWDFCRVA